MELLDGKTLAERIKENVASNARHMAKKPCLACIIVGDDKASQSYVNSKRKACAMYGLDSIVVELPGNVTQSALEREIVKLNDNKNVDGILLQLPLPPHLDDDRAINKISPLKDVDCLTYQNLGRLFSGRGDFAPCTATGIIKLLKANNVQIQGKNAVVIGRSLLVGKSVASLLEQENATVTICHSKTRNLQEVAKQADILVVAIGKAKFITADYVKEGAVVVDVGINRVDGKMYGDVDFESVAPICSKISPVPGGVGPLTVACLLENTLTLAKQARRNKQTENE